MRVLKVSVLGTNPAMPMVLRIARASCRKRLCTICAHACIVYNPSAKAQQCSHYFETICSWSTMRHACADPAACLQRYREHRAPMSREVERPHLNRSVQAIADASQQDVECDGVWLYTTRLHVLQHALRRSQVSHPHKAVNQCCVDNLQYECHISTPERKHCIFVNPIELPTPSRLNSKQAMAVTMM